MPDKKIKSGRGGWLFLALVLIAYSLLGLVNPSATAQSLTFSRTLCVKYNPY